MWIFQCRFAHPRPPPAPVSNPPAKAPNAYPCTNPTRQQVNFGYGIRLNVGREALHDCISTTVKVSHRHERAGSMQDASARETHSTRWEQVESHSQGDLDSPSLKPHLAASRCSIGCSLKLAWLPQVLSRSACQTMSASCHQKCGRGS